MKGLIFVTIFLTIFWCKGEDNVPGKKEAEIAPVISGTICDFCECNDEIINCAARQLDHNFADTPWPKKSYKLVTFENNSIVYLKQFPNVTIEKLVLSKNRITKIDDKAFKWIKNLTELDMSQNHFTSKILRPEVFEGKFSPEEWEPLDKLRVLNLANNNLHTLNQDLFEHIEDLTTLILAGNPFSVIDHSASSAFSDLRDIEELDLAYCDLKEMPEHFFHTTQSSLKRLHLNGNRFTSIPTALEEAESLEYLNLDENPFKSLDKFNGFPSLPRLKKLSLQSLPSLTKIGYGAFSELTALEELHLADCPRLKEIDDEAFVKHSVYGAIWPPLKVLDLSNNALKYLPSDLVARWDKLERLSIINNDWVCDCDNQDLIGDLLPTLGKKLMGEEVDELYCAAPPEHFGKNMSSLANRKLRCIDIYGNRPERDTAILIGLVIGLLLAIPMVMIFLFFWRRGFFFFRNSKNPGSFSRAYYKRATNDEDF